ncbi:hypothetical protein GOBAR_DD18420 [Gossypium barbadense]|nr:hypothetical protein GOBAR_DD18420 [Gossypium barbadense]
MELGLSLDGSSKPFSFLEKTPKLSSNDHLGFCLGLGRSQEKRDSLEAERRGNGGDLKRVSSDPHLQLHIRLPWLFDNLHETGLSKGRGRGLDVNRLPLVALAGEATVAHSSPNSAVSSFQMDFWFRNRNSRGKRDMDAETERETKTCIGQAIKSSSSTSGSSMSSFSWTKLKQTEVDCEYLKRCCETLTEENRRLHKEVQELRALKTCQPFYMQLPATTLTMCPSCERVTTTSATDTKIGI